MNGNDHKACYGNLFPDTLHISADRPRKGKVFSYTFITPGGPYSADRKTEVDLAEWDRCSQCPEFENCYRLSMSKLALDHAVASK